jgi:hypothetical protein
MSASPIIQCTLLSRASGSIKPIAGMPAPTSLHYNTDMRTFSGVFDATFDLSADESKKFPVQSHDLLELWYLDDNGKQIQLGVVYIEDFDADSTPERTVLQVSGRDILGQLISIPFRKQILDDTLSMTDLVEKAADSSYIEAYTEFRSRDVFKDRNAYRGKILVLTDAFRKGGAVIQSYATLALNLVYMNALGQAEVYGRVLSPLGGVAAALPGPKVGTITHGAPGTNVIGLRRRQNFSKVLSQYSVFWVDTQAKLPLDKTSIVKNEDPRAKGIYQPGFDTFSTQDLKDLAGTISPKIRIDQKAHSEIRKSNQNLNLVTVLAESPSIGGKTLKLGDIWAIISPPNQLSLPMRLAGLDYHQDPDSLVVQAQFVEPDTLI